MKSLVTSGYVFQPGAGTKSIDFTANANVTVSTLLAVLNVTHPQIVFLAGEAGLGGHWTGRVFTFDTLTGNMLPGDQLIVVVDDGAAGPLATQLPAALGTNVAASSLSVTLSSDGQFVTSIGAPANASATTDTGTFSLISLFKRSLTYLSTLAGAVTAGILQTAQKSNAPQVVSTTALGALNAVATVATDGMSTAVVQLTGTWVGTVTWQASVDGGTTYNPVNMVPLVAGGGAGVGTATVPGQWEMACGGYTHFQAKMTAYTSGSATARLTASNGTKSLRVGNSTLSPITINPGGGTPVEASALPVSLAGLSTLTTQASSTRLGYWICQNQSASPLVVGLDDGAGGATSLFVLDAGAGDGRQGGSMGSADMGPHVGRIRVYGPASSKHQLRVQ